MALDIIIYCYVASSVRFKLYFLTNRCGDVKPLSGGSHHIVSSSNYPGRSSVPSTCSNYFYVSPNTSITIMFADFDIPCPQTHNALDVIIGDDKQCVQVILIFRLISFKEYLLVVFNLLNIVEHFISQNLIFF